LGIKFEIDIREIDVAEVHIRGCGVKRLGGPGDGREAGSRAAGLALNLA
jgi:hypothetical protein